MNEWQAKIRIARSKINNLIYVDDATLMTERRIKEPLDEGERGE